MFKCLCRHKPEHLHVQKDHTEEKIDHIYTRITYHLVCLKCGKLIDIKWIKVNPNDPYIGDN